jgi:hypothetical protein
MSRINYNKFVDTSGSDYSSKQYTRTIIGRLTPKRYNAIRQVMKQYNKDAEAPYGYSLSKYPYGCGCEHDCCGCLIGESMVVDFGTIVNNQHTINITIHKSYNY